MKEIMTELKKEPTSLQDGVIVILPPFCVSKNPVNRLCEKPNGSCKWCAKS